MAEVQSPPRAGLPEERLINAQFIFLCLTNFFLFLTVYSLLVTLPLYSVALGAEQGQAGFVTAAVTLTSFMVLPHLGRYVNRLGRTTLIHIAPTLLLVEAIALPHISWFPLVVTVGVLCGAALSMFQTGATTLVADLAPLRRRGEAMGIFGTFTTTAVAISPAAAIFVVNSTDFPTLFALTTALAAIVLVLSFLIKEPPRREVPASKIPLFNRQALLPGLGIFSITLTYGMMISFLPAQAPQIGLENAGLVFTVYAVSTLLVRALAGGVSDRVGRLPVIVPALFVVGAGAMLIGQSNSPGMVLAAAAVWGLGYGAAHPTIMALAVDRSGPDHRASAVAMFNICYNLGLATGSLALGLLMQATSFGTMAIAAGAVPMVALTILYIGMNKR